MTLVQASSKTTDLKCIFQSLSIFITGFNTKLSEVAYRINIITTDNIVSVMVSSREGDNGKVMHILQFARKQQTL